jgi:hypothetical protein
MNTEQTEERSGIVAYRASAKLIAEIEAAAAAEGITRSDVARRAVMRDLAKSRDGMKPGSPGLEPAPPAVRPDNERQEDEEDD